MFSQYPEDEDSEGRYEEDEENSSDEYYNNRFGGRFDEEREMSENEEEVNGDYEDEGYDEYNPYKERDDYEYMQEREVKSQKLEPMVTAYRNLHELTELKNQFYSTNRTLWRQALARVKVLQLRGRVPHGVECTALFVSIFLSEEENSDSYLVRTAYSMALVRFVNGVLDPLQQGKYAKALTQLAKTIKLPNSFVEVRHAATHDELPSLDHLRNQTQKASKWLLDNFWNELGDETEGGWPKVQNRQQLTTEAKVLHVLKIYKKFAKQALDRDILKDPDIEMYNQLLEIMADWVASKTTYFVLVNALVADNFLIKRNEKTKMKTAIRIYMPLLEKLGPGFRFGVILSLIHNSSSYAPNPFDADCILQVIQWLQHLLPMVLQGPFRYQYYHGVIYDAELITSIVRTDLLLLEPQNEVRAVVEAILTGQSMPEKKDKKFTLPPLLDSILGTEVENEETNTKRQKLVSIFGTHDKWEVRPFGVA